MCSCSFVVQRDRHNSEPHHRCGKSDVKSSEVIQDVLTRFLKTGAQIIFDMLSRTGWQRTPPATLTQPSYLTNVYVPPPGALLLEVSGGRGKRLRMRGGLLPRPAPSAALVCCQYIFYICQYTGNVGPLVTGQQLACPPTAHPPHGVVCCIMIQPFSYTVWWV